MLVALKQHRRDDTEYRQEEREHRVPDAAGVVRRRVQELLLGLLELDLFLLLLLLIRLRNQMVRVGHGDCLERHALLTDGLVLLDLFLVAVDIVVMPDAHKIRLIGTVIMHGRIIGKQYFILLDLRIRDRDRGDQRASIRVQRIIKQFLRVGDLDDAPLINNTDTVRNKTDDRQVVRDEQVGYLLLFLELLEEIEHLGADGHVQRGDRLIGHDQFRLHDHRAGQADTLALTAGELMRIPGQVFRQETDLIDHVLDFLNAIRLILKEVEVVKTFRDDVVHRRALVEGSGRILEDHLDIADDLTVQRVGDLSRNRDALV